MSSSPFQSQAQGTNAKPIPHTHGPTAHPDMMEEEHHVNADLYRTFSPTDVAFYDWRSQMKPTADAAGKSSGTGFFSRLLGFASTKTTSN